MTALWLNLVADPIDTLLRAIKPDDRGSPRIEISVRPTSRRRRRKVKWAHQCTRTMHNNRQAVDTGGGGEDNDGLKVFQAEASGKSP